MTKYETLERLKGTYIVDVSDFLHTSAGLIEKDEMLSDVENLLIDMIHSTNVDVRDYEVTLHVKKVDKLTDR